MADDRKTAPRHTGHFPEPAAGDIRSLIGRDLRPIEVSKLVELGLKAALRANLEKVAVEWVDRFLTARGRFDPPRTGGTLMLSIPPREVGAYIGGPDEETEIPAVIAWSLIMADADVNLALLRVEDPFGALVRVYGQIARLPVLYEVNRFGAVREKVR